MVIDLLYSIESLKLENEKEIENNFNIGSSVFLLTHLYIRICYISFPGSSETQWSQVIIYTNQKLIITEVVNLNPHMAFAFNFLS